MPSSSRLAILKHGNDDDEKPDGAGANFGSFKLLGWGRCKINPILYLTNSVDFHWFGSKLLVYILYISLSYPRLTFPTIQENSSAISVLPGFIEVCGGKIDQTQSVLDCSWASVCRICFFDQPYSNIFQT